MAIEVDLAALHIFCRGMTLGHIQPLVDGEVPPHAAPDLRDGAVVWTLEEGEAVLELQEGEAPCLLFGLRNVDPDRQLGSLGLRFGSAGGVRRYFRNGYQSWDGSFFVEPGAPAGSGPPAKAPTLGFATTALLPMSEGGALVIGFSRHHRYQSRFDFRGTRDRLEFDVQTLRDRTPHNGTIDAEPIVLIDDDGVEEALRRWSRMVAAESPLPPRAPSRRITGWCSWYSLYAAIDEEAILEHLAAARAFRDKHQVPLQIFQIDDGFTPEMGDWFEVKPQFPRGMKPLLGDISAAGFTPGLWIAPFLVGNRSHLYAEHPDWVVQSIDGGPLVHMKFYGEFRWHKRSEEYYVLDVTRPEATDYIRQVFRAWRRDWGAAYFKTDFMNAGMEYGPAEARWHQSGLSRVEIWRRMAAIIRDEIGDALWLGCGCPLWASVGYVDAARIGRDIGVTWYGEYSAESLLRDQLTRNHASGILWQADPDCVLLRDRFHELTAEELESLLQFAALSGGVLMTSDRLDEIPAGRAEVFAAMLREPNMVSSFPLLGQTGDLIVQETKRPDGTSTLNVFNPSDVVKRFDPACLGLPDVAVEVRPHASLIL